MIQIKRRTRTVAMPEWGDGLEVVCSASPSFAVYTQMVAATGSEDPATLREIVTAFGEQVLISWNAGGDDGELLPATGEALLTLPMDFVFELIRRWSQDVGAVDAPLEGPSSAGSTLAALSAPTGE